MDTFQKIAHFLGPKTQFGHFFFLGGEGSLHVINYPETRLFIVHRKLQLYKGEFSEIYKSTNYTSTNISNLKFLKKNVYLNF